MCATLQVESYRCRDDGAEEMGGWTSGYYSYLISMWMGSQILCWRRSWSSMTTATTGLDGNTWIVRICTYSSRTMKVCRTYLTEKAKPPTFSKLIWLTRVFLHDGKRLMLCPLILSSINVAGATGSIKTNNITTVIGTPSTSASHVVVVSNVLSLVAMALVALTLVVWDGTAKFWEWGSARKE